MPLAPRGVTTQGYAPQVHEAQALAKNGKAYALRHFATAFSNTATTYKIKKQHGQKPNCLQSKMTHTSK